MSDKPLQQRNQKRRRKNVNTNLLQVVSQLKACNLKGLLLDSAVWVCADDAVVRMLDALCFGNLDGGEGTALYVHQALGGPAPAARKQQQEGEQQQPLQQLQWGRQQQGQAPGAEQQQQQPQQNSEPPEQGAGQELPGGQAGQQAEQQQVGQQRLPQRQRQLWQQGGEANVSGSQAVRLSLEESFFMAYALRVLEVYALPSGEEGEDQGQLAINMDTEVLWQRLQQARPDFLVHYLAYHHFRSKGWIARTGLQYGADMVLYQRHPALMHSDYSVLILPLDPRWRPPVSWHDIQVLNRLTAQVSKKLLLLYVQEEGAGASSPCDYSSPKCLARFSVREQLVRRWVPDSHRPA